MNLMKKLVSQSSKILGDSVQTIFCTMSAEEMMEKFPDVLQFCNHASRLMVSEIRRRASNQSTEAASYAIVKFLEIDSTQEQSSGWMLLTTINLFASVGHEAFINGMTIASLPSTLVKCFYLFFDLPDVQQPDQLEPGSEFTPRERRVLLQKVFVQVLIRLCSYSSPAEELVRKDDLMLLFNAITSLCPPHNITWRKSAAEVLMTLSRHGLTPNVVQYIHAKGCIGLCIENMQKGKNDLSPIEMVEMLVTLFCFLKDSSEVSQMILDDFRTCNGYNYLTEFLLSTEKMGSEEAMQALRNLILLVGSLCSCGFIELKPNLKTSSLFHMPGFVVPQSAGNGMSVRNLQAFQVLQTVFLRASSKQLCSTILDVMISLYNQDACNYFILEPQNTLPQFAEKIHSKHHDVQVKFFEIIEYVAFNLNFVPCKELISISILIKADQSISCNILCMRTLLRLLQHHSIYKDVFREVGLLEVMVVSLHRFAALLKEEEASNASTTATTTSTMSAATTSATSTNISDSSDDAKTSHVNSAKTTADAAALRATSSPVAGSCGSSSSERRVTEDDKVMGFLVMDSLLLLLNNDNAGVFRESGGARCILNLVPYRICQSKALSIVQHLMTTASGEDDMGTLLGLMQSSSPQQLQLKIQIIKSLLQVLKESHRSRTVFRKVGGFVYIMTVLVSMEGALADPPKLPWTLEYQNCVLQLIRLMFSTLSVAMRYEPANARFFSTEIRYSSLTEAIRLLGCFSSDVESLTLNEVLSDGDFVATDDDSKNNNNTFEWNSLDVNHFFFRIQAGGGGVATAAATVDMQNNLPCLLTHTTILLRHLYDLALDNFESKMHVTTTSLPSGQSLDQPANQNLPHNSTPPTFKRFFSQTDQSNSSPTHSFIEKFPVNQSCKRNSICSQQLAITPANSSEVLVIHPGAVLSFLHLIPAITYSQPSHYKACKQLQYQMCEVLKSLVRSERNQQIMCEAGLLSGLFKQMDGPLYLEKHFLHAPLQYIFERLSAQSLTPKELRHFFRLGLPLCSASEDESMYDARRLATHSMSATYATVLDHDHHHHPHHPHFHNLISASFSSGSLSSPISLLPPTPNPLKENRDHKTRSTSSIASDTTAATLLTGGLVPLTRVKCLVSMTTPRDIRLSGTSTMPAFVEFDMQMEGFGCLYLPSMAPQGSGLTPSLVAAGMMGGVTGSVDQSVHGGIGNGVC
ncbi:hypothetical protein HELRODRAFT_194319 [Helobdella robusta]|uniref:Alfy-like armadillo-like repeat domain-containing protein n=1 Tax=Helobdella robusta TaxID=6412 RepID=T1FVX4_HELRO|nr:hypothetical protein HELRODRAFT_194319 [Helobdella robusta]ESN92292.1 hypothetical protein HELRODRAFT_194319 [Helobdella robusta]